MKVTIENIKGLNKDLKVLIDKETMNSYMDEKYEEIKGTVNLKGFRPGKVPKEVLKRQFGKAVFGEVLDKVLKETSTKALEENNIPVDYITGTSAGAMIGSMYSAGISPQQMEHLFFDDKFDLMSNGGVETQYKYFFRKTDSDASMVNFRFSKDFNVPKSLPTNLTNSISLDFEYMKQYSNISAQANYNFDSLFVPFRCVASDISTKSQVVFATGHLNQAVRASMTYPGYIRPIMVDGKLLVVNPERFDRFVSTLKGKQVAIISVSGMVCDFCARGIEKTFVKDKSVLKVDVDLSGGKVLIAYSLDKKINFEEIKKKILSNGQNATDLQVVKI